MLQYKIGDNLSIEYGKFEYELISDSSIGKFKYIITPKRTCYIESFCINEGHRGIGNAVIFLRSIIKFLSNGYVDSIYMITDDIKTSSALRQICEENHYEYSYDGYLFKIDTHRFNEMRLD